MKNNGVRAGNKNVCELHLTVVIFKVAASLQKHKGKKISPDSINNKLMFIMPS